jgi:hypothetical protein
VSESHDRVYCTPLESVTTALFWQVAEAAALELVGEPVDPPGCAVIESVMVVDVRERVREPVYDPVHVRVDELELISI